MSHFTVAVITPGPAAPTEQDLSRALQPYHEYECTGVLDQYVVQVDRTEEARSEFENYTVTRYRDQDGTLHDAYADCFYREFTEEERQKHGPMLGTGGGGGLSWTSKDWRDGKGYRAKAHFIPDGFESVEVPASSVMTLREFIPYYYGYDQEIVGTDSDSEEVTGNFVQVTSLKPEGEVVRVVQLTNPNKKWDWWTVGGRWRGLLQDRQGGKHDQLQVGNLDVAGRIEAGVAQAMHDWDRLRKAMQGLEFRTMEQCLGDTENASESEREAARKAYWDQPAMTVFKNFDSNYRISKQLDIMSMECEEYINMAACGSMTTFAYVKDDEWHQKGDMGWFGMSSDEMPKGVWEKQWLEMVLDLPPESWITIVDCHI